ncbi:MAG TPA: UDP-N-acetylmuramate--L-alanine ligase [Chloroflexota bacterium]
MISPMSKSASIHFMGIGGIGMSALARILLSRGCVVSGCDRFPGEQGAALTELGIEVCQGHSPEHIAHQDLLVVTSAVPCDHAEIKAAREHDVPVMKRAELLADIMNPGRGIAVAGTHGKTTTSSLIGHLLVDAGLDPTVLVGGVSYNLGSNARVGSDLIVVEADEYDGSFLHLHPSIAVITNIEADHLDYYGTEDRVRAAFHQFACSVSDLLVVCADDPSVLDCVRDVPAPVVSYGLNAGHWRGSVVRDVGERTHFTLRHGDEEAEIVFPLAGDHNVRNALAAAAVANALGVPLSRVVEGLSRFAGVGRRLEHKGEASGVLVLDDYAHHPTEIRANLGAIKRRFRRPVRAVFQPHTYSRTHDLMQDFATAFSDADAVYVLDIYAAREINSYNVSGADLASAVGRTHDRVFYTETHAQTIERLAHDVVPGDVVVTMGAGDVTTLGSELLTRLRA